MNSAYSKAINPEIQKPKKKKRSFFSKFVLSIVFIILFFFALGLGAGFGGLIFYFSKSLKTGNMSIVTERPVEIGTSEFILLPDFTGAWYLTIEKILKEFGLGYEHSFQTGGRFYGTVLSMIPNPGSTVSKNAIIKLFVDDTEYESLEVPSQEFSNTTNNQTSQEVPNNGDSESSPTNSSIEVLPPENNNSSDSTNESISSEEGF